jgi:archaellum component FlaC
VKYEELKFWLAVIQFISTIAIGIYVWWSNREKVTNGRFTSLETKVQEMVSKPELTQAKEKRDLEIAGIKKITDNLAAACPCYPEMKSRLDGHNDRLSQHKELITRIEGEFKHLPKHDDLEKIYERVNKVSGDMATIKADVAKISGAMPGIQHITDMINDFLIQQGGKK